MKIVTDCAADIPLDEIKALDLTVAPLFIQFPEGEVDSREISADDFYDRLKRMVPKIPTTSMPASGIFSDIYKSIAEKGEEVLSIHISSGLSGTLNSARQGAAQIKSNMVNFVDTLTLSGGERFQVLAAAQAIRAGWEKEKILERLQQLRDKTEVIYTLDTLEYLRRGGRIGRVQALAGALLNLKPIINVDHKDGKYSTIGKARTINKAIEAIADHLEKEYAQTAVQVTILHGQFADQAQVLKDVLSKRLNVAMIEVMRISPVLGVHTGPGIVGAAVCPASLLAV